MKHRKTALALCIASALAGCSDSTSSNPGVSEKNSTVCLDVNMNAICDPGETSEKVATWDTENPVATTLTGAPLAYAGENGYTFTAPADFGKIYAGTTMLNNELIYNQLIDEKTKPKAKAYVHGKFGGDVTTKNKADVAEAVKNVIAAHPNESRYTVIAALMNKIFASDTVPDDIAGITVTTQDIANANNPSLAKLEITEAFEVDISGEVERQENLGWLDASDAAILNVSATNGKIVIGTQEHNGLAVIDASTQIINFSPIAVITDAGDDVDSISGASEAPMAKDGVALSSDGSSVYINIPRNDDNSDDKALGFYKVAINADGSIPTITTELDPGDGQRITIDTTKVLKNSNGEVVENVYKFSVSSDDSKVLILDEDDILSVYDSDLENQLATAITDGFSAIALSGDTVYAATEEGIKKLSTSTLEETGNIALSFETSKIMINTEGTLLVAFKSGDTQIAVVNLSDNSVNEGTVKMSSDAAAVSPDFTKLALVGEDEKRVVIVNLTVAGFSVQSAHETEFSAEAVAFINNEKIAVAHSDYNVTVLDVVTTNTNINLDSKITQAKKELNQASINHDRPFDIVLKDLLLSQSYENVDISWAEAGLSSYLALPDGGVTRPAIGQTDAVGTLTASLSASFRNEVKSGTKAFDLKIRKLVPESTITKSIPLSDDFEKHGGQMSTGPNGLLAVLLTDERDDNDKGGVFILQSNGDDFDFYIGDTDITDGETYHKFDEKGDGLAVAFTQDDQVVVATSGGQIYRFTINRANDIATTQKITLTAEETLAAAFNTAKTILAVLVVDDSENYQTLIYDIDGTGALAFNRAADMEPLSYEDKLAISDDASIIFTISGDDENIVNAQQGEAHTSFAAEAEIKGLTYLENILYATDEEGTLNGFAAGNLSSNTITKALHSGRIYTVEEADGKLFVFLYVKKDSDEGGGVSILDKNTLEEVHFIPAKGLRRGGVSPDGKSVYFFKRTEPKNISYIQLP